MATGGHKKSGTTAEEDVLAIPLSSLLIQHEARENAWKLKAKGLEDELRNVEARLIAAKDQSQIVKAELCKVKASLTAATERAEKAEAEVKGLLIKQDKAVAELASQVKTLLEKKRNSKKAVVVGASKESASTTSQTNDVAQTESVHGSCSTWYRSVEWLRAVEPSSGSYFPQVGDDLVYFKDARRRYLEKVKDLGMTETYELMQKQSLHADVTDLPATVLCRLSDVNFNLNIPGVVRLVLECSVTGRLRSDKSRQLFVFYRPVPGVPDFLILVGRLDFFEPLAPGARVWHEKSSKLGTVRKYSEQHHSYAVLTDEGKRENFSYWDTKAFGPTASATLHDSYKKRCSEVSAKVAKIMKSSAAQPFLTLRPELEIFGQFNYLIGLSIITTRLDNAFYRRATAVTEDVNFFLSNAIANTASTNFEACRGAGALRDVLRLAIATPGRSISAADWQRLSQFPGSIPCATQHSASAETSSPNSN